MTDRTATAAEIRQHYKSAGCKVRISQDGHVTYKPDGKGPWLDGRWVEEYKITENGNVFT